MLREWHKLGWREVELVQGPAARQDVAFFDDPDNSVGALTSNLRTDTAAVRSATGGAARSVCSSPMLSHQPIHIIQYGSIAQYIPRSIWSYSPNEARGTTSLRYRFCLVKSPNWDRYIW